LRISVYLFRKASDNDVRGFPAFIPGLILREIHANKKVEMNIKMGYP
jgi:hypothetical protein